MREDAERRLHEAHARLQQALQDLLSLQRRAKPQEPAPEVAHLPLETRIGLTYRTLEKALADWKQTLRQTKRLPAAA
jgi:hypothetical protein